MNPLLQRLAVTRRRFRLVTILSAICAVTAFVVGVALAIGLVDYATHLPRLFRASALVGLLTGAGFLIFQLLVHPLARRSDNLSLALRIEAKYPELNDALASTVQFLEQPDGLTNGDPRMRDKAIEKATKQAASFDFQAILEYRFLGLAALALFGSLAAAGHFWYHENDLSKTALLRLADPFGYHTWTRIDVPDAAVRLAVGQPFRIKAAVEGILPQSVKIEVQAKNPFNKKYEMKQELVVPVKGDASKRVGIAGAALDVSQKPLEFRYRVSGNDGSFPPQRGLWHEVKILQPPSYAELEGLQSPQITLNYPAYTGLSSPLKMSPGTQHLEMIQGTEVIFRAAVDRPLKQATIELRPIFAALRLATLTGLIAQPEFLPQLSPLAFHQSFSWFQPVTLDESRKVLSARFRPWIAGWYVVRLVDDNDLIKDYEADLRIMPDPLPHANLQRPATSQSYLPTAQIPVKMLAEDDVYAVRSVWLEYRRKNAQGDWLDPAPKKMPAFDLALAGDITRAITRTPWPFERTMPHRVKRLELAMLWNLKKQFEVGDIISLRMCADDYCDIFTPRRPGMSHEVELRIVSPDDLARQIDENLAQVQQELVALKQVEEEAQKLLNDLPKDKADEKALDQVIEAALKAKQVQERIGTRPNEGLRDKLEKMQQLIKDNKLPDSEVQDQIKGIQQELERLVQEEFPQLEQNLNDVRKELSGAAKPKPEAQKSPLDKAKETNKEIQKTLNELTRSLDRWADLAQLKGQARELTEKQKALAKETEKLKDAADLAGKGKQAQAMIKEEATKLSGQQKKLEQEAQDLVDKIDKSRKRQDEVARAEAGKAEDGDKDAGQRAEEAKDAAGKLRKAQAAAKMGELNRDMHKAAEDLDKGQPNAAKQQQDNAAKTLEKVTKALEGQKDDDIDRLRKKQRDAGVAKNDLDKLKGKVDKLQQAQKPGAKVDPKEQAQDLREVAEDLRDQARQLQRLQEPKAARELQKAAQKLDEAAKKVEAGENAGDLEMEAQEHIEEARRQLEHLQEELAREQLARIGDRLKGLKERQDAAVERTKELHVKVQARQQWSQGLLQTLEADRQSQTGLAKETQSLEEKLKGAMVFEHILKKAGKAMEQAGETMGQRKEAGKDRLLGKFEKEDIADEQKRQDATLKQQKLAADRLDRLLDAIKDSPPVARKDPPKKEQKPKDDQGKEPEEPKGGLKAQDGIPPMAQLKALKAEQVEIFERTKDFARENPNVQALDEPRLRELRELTEEQARLRQLFEQMTAPREKEGGMP